MTTFVDPHQDTDICLVGDSDTIALTTTYHEAKRLVSIAFNWDADVAPTTAENITVSIDSALGATYDVLLLTRDPSTFGGGFHKWVWTPDDDFVIKLTADDQIVVAYANTDDLGIGVVVTLEAI